MSISDMSQYRDVFLDEAQEQLSLLETNILQMERGDHSPEMVQILFRAAHTLKGSSRAMGFLAIGDLTHEMENVLDDLRQERISAATPTVDALLVCLDSLTALVDAVRADGTDTGAGRDIPALVARLNALRPRAELAPATGPADTGNIVLTDYERTSLDAATDAGMNVYLVEIVLSADCLMKSVRVFMVFGGLDPIGAVLVAQPGEEDLEAENFERAFQLIFATGESPEAVQQVLTAVSEVESVTVTAWQEAPLDPPAEARPSALPPVAAHAQTIRVDVARLDNLMNLIGELVIDRTQITRLGDALHGRYPREDLVSQLLETAHRVARISGELQDEVMKARMLPIDSVFQRLPRMVRDLAQKTGKEIDLRLLGGETELDRSVLEHLGDPLIHLLRNSVDHGIEPPEERLAAGKPREGVVALSARHEGSHIVIQITDDGGGIDPITIKAAAVRKGLITQAAADALTDRDALLLIFASGFSTAAVVSDISGRGVGMDIVKANLENLGGRIFVESVVGQGSRFLIHLPLTLAIVRALLVGAGGGTYVLPLGSVVEMLRLGTQPGAVCKRSVGGQASILLRGQTVPLASLADVLCGEPEATRSTRIAEDAFVVIVGWAERQIGLCVDALLGEQEVVIKSLSALLGDIPGLSGATILGDGRVALILDVAQAVACIRLAGRERVH